MEDALADAARIGPFFAIGTDPGVTDDPLWRPFTELLGRALSGQIETVRARLGTGEARVAASILFQGIASHLWSPVLATAAGHGLVPDLHPATTYWRAASPGPIILAAPGTGALTTGPLTTGPPTTGPPTTGPLATGRPSTGVPTTGPPSRGTPGRGTPTTGAGVIRRVVVERHLRPLAEAIESTTPIAAGLLWGNAASALMGAFGVLAGARPRHTAAGRRLADDLLGAPPLRGTGEMGPHGFRRRSCCLYYRVPGGGMCGDCALL